MHQICSIKMSVLVGGSLALAVALLPQGARAGAANDSMTPSEVARLVDVGDYEALRALGPDVMEVLAEIYTSREATREREKVAWAFYQLGFESQAAVAALMPDVEGEVDENLRISAQYALGRVGDDPVIVEVLLRNMRTAPTFHLRDKAACALAYDQVHLSERQKVLLFAGLIDALEDPKADVRHIAILALSIHTGQRKGFVEQAPIASREKAIRAWREWLAEYRAQL